MNESLKDTSNGAPAGLAVDAGSAIGYPECGSEAWKNQEVERMLDNDRYDRDQEIAKLKADNTQLRERIAWWTDNAEGIAKDRSELRRELETERELRASAQASYKELVGFLDDIPPPTYSAYVKVCADNLRAKIIRKHATSPNSK